MLKGNDRLPGGNGRCVDRCLPNKYNRIRVDVSICEGTIKLILCITTRGDGPGKM